MGIVNLVGALRGADCSTTSPAPVVFPLLDLPTIPTASAPISRHTRVEDVGSNTSGLLTRSRQISTETPEQTIAARQGQSTTPVVPKAEPPASVGADDREPQRNDVVADHAASGPVADLPAAPGLRVKDLLDAREAYQIK
jgi:hypothetical protein